MCVQTDLTVLGWQTVISHIPASWAPHVLGILYDMGSNVANVDIAKTFFSQCLQRLVDEAETALFDDVLSLLEVDPSLFPPLVPSSDSVAALSASVLRFLSFARVLYQAADQPDAWSDPRFWHGVRLAYHNPLWTRLEHEYFTLAHITAAEINGEVLGPGLSSRPFISFTEAEDAARKLYARATYVPPAPPAPLPATTKQRRKRAPPSAPATTSASVPGTVLAGGTLLPPTPVQTHAPQMASAHQQKVAAQVQSPVQSQVQIHAVTNPTSNVPVRHSTVLTPPTDVSNTAALNAAAFVQQPKLVRSAVVQTPVPQKAPLQTSAEPASVAPLVTSSHHQAKMLAEKQVAEAAVSALSSAAAQQTILDHHSLVAMDAQATTPTATVTASSDISLLPLSTTDADHSLSPLLAPSSDVPSDADTSSASLRSLDTSPQLAETASTATDVTVVVDVLTVSSAASSYTDAHPSPPSTSVVAVTDGMVDTDEPIDSTTAVPASQSPPQELDADQTSPTPITAEDSATTAASADPNAVATNSAPHAAVALAVVPAPVPAPGTRGQLTWQQRVTPDNPHGLREDVLKAMSHLSPEAYAKQLESVLAARVRRARKREEAITKAALVAEAVDANIATRRTRSQQGAPVRRARAVAAATTSMTAARSTASTAPLMAPANSIHFRENSTRDLPSADQDSARPGGDNVSVSVVDAIKAPRRRGTSAGPDNPYGFTQPVRMRLARMSPQVREREMQRLLLKREQERQRRLKLQEDIVPAASPVPRAGDPETDGEEEKDEPGHVAGGNERDQVPSVVVRAAAPARARSSLPLAADGHLAVGGRATRVHSTMSALLRGLSAREKAVLLELLLSEPADAASNEPDGAEERVTGPQEPVVARTAVAASMPVPPIRGKAAGANRMRVQLTVDNFDDPDNPFQLREGTLRTMRAMTRFQQYHFLKRLLSRRFPPQSLAGTPPEPDVSTKACRDKRDKESQEETSPARMRASKAVVTASPRDAKGTGSTRKRTQLTVDNFDDPDNPFQLREGTLKTMRAMTRVKQYQFLKRLLSRRCPPQFLAGIPPELDASESARMNDSSDIDEEEDAAPARARSSTSSRKTLGARSSRGVKTWKKKAVSIARVVNAASSSNATKPTKRVAAARKHASSSSTSSSSSSSSAAQYPKRRPLYLVRIKRNKAGLPRHLRPTLARPRKATVATAVTANTSVADGASAAPSAAPSNTRKRARDEVDDTQPRKKRGGRTWEALVTPDNPLGLRADSLRRMASLSEEERAKQIDMILTLRNRRRAAL